MKLKESNQGQQNGCPSIDQIELAIEKLVRNFEPIRYECSHLNRAVAVEHTEYLKSVMEKNGIFIRNTSIGVKIYTGAMWDTLENHHITRILEKTLSKTVLYSDVGRKHHKLTEDMKAQLLHISESAILKSPSHLINFSNGTFNTQTGKLQQHSPKDEFTYILDYEYNPEETCPMFLSFWDEVLPDKSLQLVVQEYLGYIFSDLKMEKVLILEGKGANGKSVLLEIAKEIVGENNTTAYNLETLTKPEGLCVVPYSQALLNIGTDISPKIADSGVFKQLVSCEPLQAKIHYKGYVTITPSTKMVFSTNNLFESKDSSDGFFRRFIIIPFTQTIPKEKQDKMLAKKIVASELSGIFNWIFEGKRRLEQSEAFSDSETIDKIIAEYRMRADSIASFIKEECWIPDVSEKLKFSDLYYSYTGYCHENDSVPESAAIFSRKVRDLGFTSRNGTGNIKLVYARQAI